MKAENFGNNIQPADPLEKQSAATSNRWPRSQDRVSTVEMMGHLMTTCSLLAKPYSLCYAKCVDGPLNDDRADS